MFADWIESHPISGLNLPSEAPPKGLLEAMERNRAVAFVGSGVSKLAGLPLWGELLKNLREEVILHHPRSSLAQGDVETEPRALATQLKNEMGEFDFYLRLREQIAARQVPERIPCALFELVALPFRFFVTLNYDKLVERAFRRRHGYDLPVFTCQSLSPKQLERLVDDFDGPFLLKLHGDLDAFKTIVLSSDDYQGFEENGYVDFVRTLFERYTLLIAGCSLTGDYIESIVDERRDSPDARWHYKIEHQPEDSVYETRREQRIEVVSVEGAETYDDTYSGILRRLRGFSLVYSRSTAEVLKQQRVMAQCNIRSRLENAIPNLELKRELLFIPSSLPDYDIIVAGYLRDVDECDRGAKQRPYAVWGVSITSDFSVECTKVVMGDEFGVILGLYPGVLFNQTERGFLIEELQYGGSSQYYSIYAVDETLQKVASLSGEHIEIDDFDLDGRLEFRCWHEKWHQGCHADAVSLPSTYRFDGESFVNVTFENREIGSAYLVDSFPWRDVSIDAHQGRENIVANWLNGVREDIDRFLSKDD